MTATARPTSVRAGARLVAATALAVLLLSFPSPSLAQQTGMTLQSSPPDAWISLSGAGDLTGVSPLDLGPEWVGAYRVTVQAPGHGTAEGVIYFPGPGGVPHALSDPPGLSGGVLLRSLYFPGVPQLLDHRTYRGAAFLAAGVGGLGAAVRDHLEYSSQKDDADPEKRARALDFQYARNRWALYTGAVWALSALDNIVHPRLEVVEATTSRVTVRAPQTSRSGIVTRSLLVPGAGQDAVGARLRGAAWLGATFVSGAATMTALESHRRIETKLGLARDLLANAPPGEVPDRQADVDRFVEREDDSSRLVSRLALTTFAIYAANVVDAAFVHLGESGTGSKVSFAPGLDARRHAVSVNLRF